MRHRSDNNQSDLIDLARELRWLLWYIEEPEDWIGLYRGQWHVISVKNPDKEGHADEFTTAQVIFHTKVKNAGGRVLIWRRDDDVFKDSGARRSV